MKIQAIVRLIEPRNHLLDHKPGSSNGVIEVDKARKVSIVDVLRLVVRSEKKSAAANLVIEIASRGVLIWSGQHGARAPIALAFCQESPLSHLTE